MIKEIKPLKALYFYFVYPIDVVQRFSNCFPTNLFYIYYKLKMYQKTIGYFVDGEIASLLIFDKKFNRIDYCFTQKKFRNKGIAKKLIQSQDFAAVEIRHNKKEFWNKL